MRLRALVLLLLLPTRTPGADIPGPALTLGDDRFRAGGPVAELLFSPDGAELTSWTPIDRDTVRRAVWVVPSGRLVRSADIRPEARVRWHPTSYPDAPRGVVIGSDGVPVVRDFVTGIDVARLNGHFARATAAAVSPDGKLIATASADGVIRIWDAETFRPLGGPGGHTAPVRGVDVSPDGRLAVTTAADGTARVWRLDTGKELRAFPVAGDGLAVFTRDGTAVRLPASDGVVTRDLTTGLEVVPTTPPPADVLALPTSLLAVAGVSWAASPDGRVLAVATGAEKIMLIEVVTGQVRRRLPGRGRALRFTPDGGRLLAAAGAVVEVWPVGLRDVPLPPDLKRETSAAKLWDRMAGGDAATAYLAMARLAADPPAARAMARLRPPTGVGRLRVQELFEAIGGTAGDFAGRAGGTDRSGAAPPARPARPD